MIPVPFSIGRAWGVGGCVFELLRLVDGRGQALASQYGAISWRVNLEVYRRVLVAKGIYRLPLSRVV